MDGEETATVKVPTFYGDEKNYQSWRVRFEAFARVKGFVGVLVDSGITIKEDEVETLELKPKFGSGLSGTRNADEEKQYRLGKRNLLEMAHLTISFTSEGLLNKIASATTDECPGGLTYKLMDALKTRYAPKDRMIVV